MEESQHQSDPNQASDTELVLRTQTGDGDAFDQLALRYQKQLYNVIYNIVLNYEDAKDVLVETLYKAFANISRFRKDAKFYTWIYQIAYNESINLIRKRKRNVVLNDLGSDESGDSGEERSEFTDQRLSADTIRQLNVKELENKLNEALSTLSEEHRTVVNLFDIQDLSHSEIASIMRCSEGTVRSRLHYAHKQLQKLLRNYI